VSRLRTETFAGAPADQSFTWDPPPEGARILSVRFNLTTAAHTVPGSIRVPLLSFRFGKVTAAATVWAPFRQGDNQDCTYQFFLQSSDFHMHLDSANSISYARAELPEIDLGANWQMLLSVNDGDGSDSRGTLSLTYLPLR